MKKIFFLFTINFLFSSQHFVTAQSRSIAETNAILCSYKWLLSAEEWLGKKVPVSEWLKGTYCWRGIFNKWQYGTIGEWMFCKVY